MLSPGDRVRVHLVKRLHSDVVYPMNVLADDGDHLVVEGPWAEPEARDLGFATFEPGDRFTEHYWRDRWYSVKEVRSAAGALKGWYCDVTRPVRTEDGLVVSVDLDLDLWISGDRRTVLRLDEEEFVATGLATTDPPAAEQARQAIAQLEQLANDGWDELLVIPAVPGSSTADIRHTGMAEGGQHGACVRIGNRHSRAGLLPPSDRGA